MKLITFTALIAGSAICLVPVARAIDKPVSGPTTTGANLTPVAAKDTTAGSSAPSAPGKPTHLERGTNAAPSGKSGAGAGTKPAAGKTPAGVDSLQLLERIVAKDSTHFDNLFHLGLMYLDRDSIPEAIRVFLKANRLRPKDVPAMVNLGAALDAGGRPDEAQKYYRHALEISPDDPVASCRLASSLYAQSKYPEAMDMLRDIIAKQPNSYCAYFTLGVAFAEAGIYRDAVRMWKKVVELAPNSPEAVSAKESIEVLEKFIKTQ